MKKKEALRTILIPNLSVFVAYWAVSHINWLIFHTLGVLPMPLWPAAAIALVAGMYWGWKIAPGIALGAICANYFSLGSTFSFALAIAVMNTIAPIWGGQVIRASCGIPFIITSMRKLAIGVIIGVIIVPSVGALGGVGSKYLLGLMPASAFFINWLKWAIAHSLGVLFFTPLILLWIPAKANKAHAPTNQRKLLYATVLILSLSFFFFFRCFESVFDYLWYHYPEGSFWNSIFVTHDSHELFLDSVVFFLIMLGGGIAYRALDNIIEQKNLAAQKEENLTITLNSIEDAVISTDSKGNIIRMNPTAQHLTGWTIKEAFGKPLEEVFNIINAETKEKAANPLDEVLATNDTVILANHTILISKTGEEYKIADSAAPIRDFENNIVGIVIVFRNVTEQYRIEQQLISQRTLANMIIQSMPGLFYIVNKKTLTFERVNDNFTFVSGYTHKELQRMSALELFEEGHDRDLCQERINEAFTIGAATMENNFLTREGKKIPYFFTGKELVIDSEEYLIGAAVDISERIAAVEKMRATQGLLEAAIAQSPSGILIADAPHCHIRLANMAALNIRGGRHDLLTNIDVVDYSNRWQTFRPDGTVYPPEKLPLSRAILEGITTQAEELIVRDEQGQDHWVSTNAAPVRDEKGTITAGVAIFHDITERKKMEESLRENESQYRILFDAASDAILLMRKFTFTDCNRKALEMFGCTKKDIIGSTPLKFSSRLQADGRDTRVVADEKMNAVLKGEPQYFEWKHKRKDGTEFDAEVSLNLVNLTKGIYVQAIVRDVTERKRAEEKIKATLKEKETLLRELYHRTKNNMQVISGLLTLQSRYSRDETIVTIFNEMIQRIEAMTLVHQKLYQSQDLSKISLKDYYAELVDHIKQAYDVDEKNVIIRQDIEDLSVVLDVAIPCGLMLNELLSNALKHAFPEGAGEISILVRKLVNKDVELIIKDNGKGVDDSFNIKECDSMGLRTVRMIAEHQLGGSISFVNDGGLQCRIVFNNEIYAERV